MVKKPVCYLYSAAKKELNWRDSDMRKDYKPMETNTGSILVKAGLIKATGFL